MTNGIQQVLSSELCVGCGGCAYAAGGHMQLDRYGFYRPGFDLEAVDAATKKEVDKACPFLWPELNEDELADRFLPPVSDRDHKIGKYHSVFAAHAEEGDFRGAGSSGGIGSWLSAELLNRGMVDGVIHARPVQRTNSEDPFFRYGISRNSDELKQAAHSHYHVVEISEVLNEIKHTPGRYLFVGIPCIVKAVRRAQLLDPDIAERITYTLALVCGHTKSVHWALSLGWGAGIKPEDISAITFRVKSKNVPAKAYFFSIKHRTSGVVSIHDSAPLIGGKFNLGAMMPDACSFCDDVVGETADLTIGDAWLPRYAYDWRGKNMVVSRNPELTALFREASSRGRIVIESMTVKEAAEAQAGGFRQRREGLAHRLARAKKLGRWTPVKRMLPDIIRPGPLRGWIYTLREQVSQRSREAFRRSLDSDDMSIYVHEMGPIFGRLRLLELSSALFRIASVRLRALFFRKHT